jgi:hypothetical protein
VSRAVHTRIAALCLSTAALLGFAPRTHAAEGDEQKRSAEFFKAGLAAGKAGDYAQAESAFRASYALRPSASSLRNWALAEMKVGKMVEALAHLRLAAGWSGWTAEQRRVVQENLDDAYGATGHLSIKTTDGARVAIDGVVLEATTPLDAMVDVAAGMRKVEAGLGPRTARAEVDAQAGKIVEVTLLLPAEAAQPVPVKPAFVSDPTPPRADVLSERDAPTWWTVPHAVAVGLGATAVLGAGLGVYFEAASHAAASDASTLRASIAGGTCAGAAAPAECGALQDKIGAVHQDETLADVSFAVGGVAAVGAAVVLAVVGAKPAVRTGTVRWTPALAPGAAGIAGSF